MNLIDTYREMAVALKGLAAAQSNWHYAEKQLDACECRSERLITRLKEARENYDAAIDYAVHLGEELRKGNL